MLKKFIVYGLWLMVIIYLTPIVHAGHEVGTEGKYCDGSEIWQDLLDGNHEYTGTDCADFGQLCEMLENPPLNADARCQNVPATTNLPTSDEVAVENLNQGLLPPDINQDIKPQEKNIFQQIIAFLTNLLGFKPTFPEIFHPRSDIQQNIHIPPEFKPQSDEENTLLPKFLGEEVGIYSVTVPSQINQQSINTRGFENTFEQANFPPGIHPITGP